MKSFTSKSKPFQSRNSWLSLAGRRLSRSKFKKPFSTDSDAELFMYSMFNVLGAQSSASELGLTFLLIESVQAPPCMFSFASAFRV